MWVVTLPLISFPSPPPPIPSTFHLFQKYIKIGHSLGMIKPSWALVQYNKQRWGGGQLKQLFHLITAKPSFLTFWTILHFVCLYREVWLGPLGYFECKKVGTQPDEGQNGVYHYLLCVAGSAVRMFVWISWELGESSESEYLPAPRLQDNCACWIFAQIWLSLLHKNVYISVNTLAM